MSAGLFPIATTEFGIRREDETGGSGANLIVEWVFVTSVSDSVIEVIMAIASRTQGYRFLTSRRVIKEFSLDSGD
ncbi:DUF3124 domain-containing protein [Baaleninema simplex]|uniref:DUF3124 domain-containing protein n=1 Tax=Baaleninema simplex TaxID=2862350 RepID=UPI000A032B3C